MRQKEENLCFPDLFLHLKGQHNYYYYTYGDGDGDILDYDINLCNESGIYQDWVEDSFDVVEVDDGGYVQPAN